MHPDHYAVVIGLSAYPRLGDPPGANLQGPENDADAVYAWLTNEQEGGLPKENVKRICSRDFRPPPDALPSRDMLEIAFRWLDRLARDNELKDGRRVVGKRLYFYASGHGFSPRFRQACLLAGNAAEDEIMANISPSLWLEWWQDAEYFREYVLWMDCCMDRQMLTQPQPAPLVAIGGGTAPGPCFIAFAASRPLKAVEKPIPEDSGKYHGVFTWNLLRGLRGAAVNSFGMVTGGSLADWLRHAQLGWMQGADLSNPDIAKEPAIIDEDDGLVFARGLDRAAFNVTLLFPCAAAGLNVRIWSGAPPRPGAPLAIKDGRLTVSLPAGPHVVDVPGTALRHGLVVTRDAEIEVTDTGEAPQQSSGLFQITIHPDDPTAEIRLVGNQFQTVDMGSGGLSARLPHGLYVMRIRVGRQFVEKVILLDADWPRQDSALSEAAQALPEMPIITSAAPLPTTSATHEPQQQAVVDSLGRIDVKAGDGAQLMVMARMFTADGTGGKDARPWEGVRVLDRRGATVADLAVHGRPDTGQDPFNVCTIALSPGAYVLRHITQQGGAVAQSLILPPGGWRLEAYLLDRPGFSQPAARLRCALLMRRIGAPWGTAEDVLLEKARVALTDERPVLSEELSSQLLTKSDNPLAGIIGGHLLLIEREQGLSRQFGLLNEVVENLRVLVGSDHPDVEALSLACPRRSLRRTDPVRAAPLFERSWWMLVEGSRTNKRLVPTALWRQVQAEGGWPPFLSWSLDTEKQEAFLLQLARSVFAPADGKAETMAGSDTEALLHDAVVTPMIPASGLEMAYSGTTQGADGRRAGREAATRVEAMGLPPIALDALRRKYRAGL